MRSRVGIYILFVYTVRRFRKDRDGSAAVQFALIGIPSLMMLFAIFETALVLFANQALLTVVHDTAGQIMTVQGEIAGKTAAQFKTFLLYTSRCV